MGSQCRVTRGYLLDSSHGFVSVHTAVSVALLVVQEATYIWGLKSLILYFKQTWVESSTRFKNQYYKTNKELIITSSRVSRIIGPYVVDNARNFIFNCQNKLPKNHIVPDYITSAR